MNAWSHFATPDRRVSTGEVPGVGKTRGRVKMDLINRLRALVRDDSGQDLIEYALLAGLIALVSVFAIQAAGLRILDVWNGIVNMLNQVPV